MNLRGDITPAFSNTGTGPGEKSALQRALEGILFNSASGIVESTADDAGMVASLASVLADPIRSGEAAGRSVRQALPAISQGVSNFVSQPPSEMLSSAGALGNAALKAIQQGVEERGIGGVASATDFVPAGMLAGALPLLADLGKAKKALEVADTGVDLFHGGARKIGRGEIWDDVIEPMKYGLFTSRDKGAAASHIVGKGEISEFNIPENRIASSGDLSSASPDIAMTHLKGRFPEADSDEIDLLYDVLIDESDSDQIAEILEKNGMLMEGFSGEADWVAQRERGRLAAALGFDAVEVADEHGTSILLLPQGMGDMARVDVQAADNLTPNQRRLRELAEGVENPGALERGRLEGASGGIKRSGITESEHNALLAELREADRQQKGLELQAKDDPGNRELYARVLEARVRTMKANEALENIREPISDSIEAQRQAFLSQLDNLDPVEKARLDRAVQQGFDLDAYHGTKGDIQSFDPGLLGATTGAPSARVGFFFAADPATAATYARSAKLKDVRPDVSKKIESIEERQLNLNINAPDYGEQRGALIAERQALEQGGDNILPVKLRLQNPLVHDFGGGSYREVSYRELLDQAQREGKDGAIFRNTRDGGPVTDIYVVFEPSQIRSRFAAFDPKDAPTVGEARQVADRTDLESLRTPIESEIRQLQDEIGQAALGKIAVPPKIVDTSVQEARLAELMEQSFLIAEKKRGVGTGNTGDITATMPPVLFPLGAGTAAVAYSANQESD